MLGLSLGLVFVPCAGPVLATITVVGTQHHIGWSAVLLTAAFAVGVAVPLLVFALAGQSWPTRMRPVRTHARHGPQGHRRRAGGDRPGARRST